MEMEGIGNVTSVFSAIFEGETRSFDGDDVLLCIGTGRVTLSGGVDMIWCEMVVWRYDGTSKEACFRE